MRVFDVIAVTAVLAVGTALSACSTSGSKAQISPAAATNVTRSGPAAPATPGRDATTPTGSAPSPLPQGGTPSATPTRGRPAATTPDAATSAQVTRPDLPDPWTPGACTRPADLPTGLDPELVRRWRLAQAGATRAGYTLTVTSGFRDWDAQAQVYAEQVRTQGSPAAARRWALACAAVAAVALGISAARRR